MITKILFTGYLFLLLAGCATAQRGALSRAQSAYGKKEFQKCLAHVDRSESYGNYSDAMNARLSFQKGLCLEGAGRKAEAVAIYRRLIERFPNTDWSAQAKARIEE